MIEKADSLLFSSPPPEASLSMLYAEVAVNATFPHRDSFSYSVPEGIEATVGCAVYVPFGRLTLQGVVMELHETPVFSPPEKIRPLRSVIGDGPLIDAERIAVAKWITGFYLAPIFDAVALMLPPGFERRPRTTVRPLVDGAGAAELELPARLRQVLEASIARPGFEIDALRAQAGGAGIDGEIVQLERRGLISREYGLARPSVAARTAEYIALATAPGDARRRINGAEPPKHSRRADVLDHMLPRREISVETAIRLAGSRANLERLVRSGDVRYDRDGHNVALAMSPLDAQAEITKLRESRRSADAMQVIDVLAGDGEQMLSELRSRIGVNGTVARWLAELGAVTLTERAIERDPLEDLEVVRRGAPALLPAQQSAADAICVSIDGGGSETFLLHGVTGSGKTEVYLAALDHCVSARKKGIVLVPEIALTPQTVRRFRERFERVAVLHSALSPGEMFDQWHGVARGEYDVVIGARSAIFAPQPDLALIVIDEEHEWTYKQADASPRYHSRDVATELARLKDATVVLGSATPDVCSYDAATRGEYTLLSLPERIRPVIMPSGQLEPVASPAMPEITVVDLRDELRTGNRGMFSAELRTAVEEVLANDEQAILFLNRRGLASHVQCRDCGYVPACSSCGIAMSFHRQYDRLVCHQCNRRARLPATCRECGSPRVRLLGAGVEKLEVETARLFPQARLLRWDRDATRGRRSHERILAAFLAREADILIGTQMLAKGLDLPAVTLVGVVSADVGLHVPDMRAGERTFQLLTQVAGRAGRGERPGRVIIQTYTPDHYAVEAASRHDYDGFVATELELRERAAYPPFTRLVRMLHSHPNPRFAKDEAVRMQRELSLRRAEVGSDATIVGPSPPYVARLRGRWRWQLLLRGRDPADLLRDVALPPNWAVDVDPVTLV